MPTAGQRRGVFAEELQIISGLVSCVVSVVRTTSIIRFII